MNQNLIPTYSSQAVASYLLELAAEERTSLDKMQIMKLVYLCHGWHLGLRGGEPLIHDAIEAWKYGPVIPILFGELAKHPTYENVPTNFFGKKYKSEGMDKNKKAMEMIKDIWKFYRKFTGLQLSSMTHKEGTPWALLYHNGTPNFLISDSVIRNYYDKLIKDIDAKEGKKRKK